MNTTPRKPISRSTGWIIITILCGLLLLPGLFRIPVTDVDEARFAQATKQMVETHDYLHINIQNTPRHLKPPAIYWLQAMATHATQKAPYNQIFSYRLPSFIAATATAVLIFLLCAPLFGNACAFIASVVFATTLIVSFEASFSTTDACLMLSIFVMQFALGRIYINHCCKIPTTKRWPALFWFAMAIGIFIKGIAPVFALGTIAGLSIAERNIRWTKALHPIKGLIALLLLTLAWLLPFSIASHSNFLWDMISQDVLHKVTGGQEGHGQPVGFYLLLMPLLYWPMSLYFTAATNYARQCLADPKIRFLLAWIIPNWIIYELIPTKLVHYLMPIFPAMALLIAMTLMQHLHQQAPRTRITGTIIEAVIWLFYNSLLAVGIIYASYSITHTINTVAIIACGVVLLNTVLAYVCFKTKRTLASLSSNVIAAIVVYGLLFNLMLPNMALLWNSKRVATVLQLPHFQQQLQQGPLLVSGYHEPSLIFEVGTESINFVPLTTIEQAFTDHTANLVLLGTTQFKQFKDFANEHHIAYQLDAELPGYDLNHGHHITLTLLEPSNERNNP